MSNRNVQRAFLAFAILFELFLCLASSLYLGVTSISFALVAVVMVLSVIWIIVRVRAIDHENDKTIYG